MSRIRLAPLLLLLGCLRPSAKGTAPPAPEEKPKLEGSQEWVDPEALLPTKRTFPRAARPAPAPVVIRHATILTAAGQRIEDGTLVLEGGRITAIGDASLGAPEGATEVDGKGRYLTPGVIDAHSHLGVYSVPSAEAANDGNEMTDPITAEVAAEWGYNAQDPAIPRAQAGGVTAALILPGSANLIGGRGIVVEMRTGASADDVRFPGAPPMLKMACGENPKRTYGKKGGPQTRMGEYAAFREAFRDAAEYAVKQGLYEKARAEWEQKRAQAARLAEEARRAGKKPPVEPVEAPDPPKVDPTLEVLAAVLSGEILAQVHCYAQQDIAQMLAIADEFGFTIRSFHHALEAYKVRDAIVKRGTAIATWADWWGFKMEAFDGIPENAALFAEAGGRVAIHSDSPYGIQRLNQEAAKAWYAGLAAGIQITEDQALRWITANPAWILGIDAVTGTLEPGKRADVVLWSHHPFSVYARADLVLVAGEVVYDRAKGREPTDFELGNSAVVGDEGGAP